MSRAENNYFFASKLCAVTEKVTDNFAKCYRKPVVSCYRLLKNIVKYRVTEVTDKKLPI